MPRDTFPLKVGGVAAGALLLVLAAGLYAIFGVEGEGGNVVLMVQEEAAPPPPDLPGADRGVASSRERRATSEPSPAAVLPFDPFGPVGSDRSAATRSPAPAPEQTHERPQPAERTATAPEAAATAEHGAAESPAMGAAPDSHPVESLPPGPKLLGVPIYRDPAVPPEPVEPGPKLLGVPIYRDPAVPAVPVEPDTLSRSLPTSPGQRQARPAEVVHHDEAVIRPTHASRLIDRGASRGAKRIRARERIADARRRGL